MPRDTAEMFNLLRNNPLMSPFILIGGTGLALHIGHRRSEDLDFVTLQKRLPRAVLKKIEDDLRAAGHQVVQTVDAGASDDFENAGMDINDYTQNLLVDGVVKLTFFTADAHHENLLKENEDKGGEGFRIASLNELSQLKAIVVASRAKSRDWVDLFLLERDHQFGLQQWKEAYDKAGYTDVHFEMALKRICDGKIRDDDEGYSALMPDPPSVEKIALRFKELQKAYEVSSATKLRK